MQDRQEIVLTTLLMGKPLLREEWLVIWNAIHRNALGQLQPSTLFLVYSTHKNMLYIFPHWLEDLAHILAQDFQATINILLVISREEVYMKPDPEMVTTLHRGTTKRVTLADKMRQARGE